MRIGVRATVPALLYNPRRAPPARFSGFTSMTFVDYLVIVIIVVSSAIGIIRAFLREAVSLASWVLALLLAWRFSDVVEPHLGGLLADPDVRPWAARVLIAVGVLLFGMAVGAVLNYFVRLSIFSGTDRFLGFVFGLL